MLKRESRILGLSATTRGSKRVIASVVFRGSLWLDGVATTTVEAKERNYNLKVSNLIRNSKQFSQLHAIIISQRLTRIRVISIQKLARSVKLPVIAIEPRKGSGRENRRVNKFVLMAGGERVAATAAGVNRDQAEELYGIGCSPHRTVPEAVRVADLLAEQLSTSALQHSLPPRSSMHHRVSNGTEPRV